MGPAPNGDGCSTRLLAASGLIRWLRLVKMGRNQTDYSDRRPCSDAGMKSVVLAKTVYFVRLRANAAS